MHYCKPRITCIVQDGINALKVGGILVIVACEWVQDIFCLLVFKQCQKRCWLDYRQSLYVCIATAGMIKLNRRRRGKERLSPKQSRTRPADEQTSYGLLLHVKPKRKQSLHLPDPKRFSLLAFLRDICVYPLYCKTFHVGQCMVL